MASGTTSSTTSGTNPYNFQTGLTDTSSQMPSALGGLNSTSNLYGNGTSSDGSYYDPQSGQLFSMPTSSSSGVDLTKLQNSLAMGGKISASGQGSSQPTSMRQMSGKVSLPSENFSSGMSGVDTSGNSSGVKDLISLMQQLKG